jgi:hypothetical protein
VFGSHLVPEQISVRHTRAKQFKRGQVQVLGFDSETLQGPPITLQFYGGSRVGRFNGCIFIGKRRAVDVFLGQLKKLQPGNYRMYGHNLEFDMLSALWEQRVKMRDGNIALNIGDWQINGRYSKPVFAVFDDGERYIELVDSMLWFQTSLEKAGNLICPDLPKLKRPAGLGTTMFTSKDDDFIEYAMRDAVVAYHLGNAIEKFHEELGVTSQISLASMAASVFRRYYMRDDMYQPPLYEWIVGAAASYHGGVNRVKPGASPAWHINVSALDLSSAYPAAWMLLPAFSNPNAYKHFKVKLARKTRSVPEIGIYQVSGRTSACNWPALFDHNFKPLKGGFSDVWVSGFELNQALAAGEFTPSKITGFSYDVDMEDGYSPFAAFASNFYEKKSTEKDPVLRYMHKIVLNAPTGKLIQTSPDFTLIDGKLVKIKRAGGLYHPTAASLTTGHTRSVMHPLEHEYEALHTATDGIFAPGHHSGAKEKRLGAVVAEGHGDLALFRNKLYIFYTDEESEGTYPSQVFEGRHILKCARHGFQGRVVDLEQMLVSNLRGYKVNKPIKLKTAIKQKEAPNKFVISERKLRNVEGFKVVTHE